MKLIIPLTVLFIYLIVPTISVAGATIIHDNRVTDLSTTPALGRGYSIATNTFQSSCMKNVITTEPFYDMKYSFEQIEEKGIETGSMEEQNRRDESGSERRLDSSSLTPAGLHYASPFGAIGINRQYKSTRFGIDGSKNTASKKTVINGRTWYRHSILVTLSIYSYYASLDESRSKLSPSAQTILQGNGLPGFFSSCFPYYVRSIGRFATFVSVFTYHSEKETRDKNFEDQLRTEISKFSTESKRGFKAGFAPSPIGFGVSESSQKRLATQSSIDFEEQRRKETFNRQAENYRLTINTSAFGIGKGKKATLISFDVDSFKTAAKDAFMAMQNSSTGKVSSIEVVPWVENTEFQALVKLESEVIPTEADDSDVTGDSENGITEGPRTQLLYEKKHILNQNAEFFMEIERADRNKLNMYYKARLCKKTIDMNFKEGKEIKDEFVDATLLNHRGGVQTTIEYLDKKMSQKFVDSLYQKEKEFMYGIEGNDGFPGASECIRQIMQEGIYKKSYREIEQCQIVTKEMGHVQSDLLENYCMPELAN
ncbi:MAG: hypothetical protein GY786_03855 [Proteobacteria bacterium]|nr:hypothetical protein [Pseudomonadota bacterium]